MREFLRARYRCSPWVWPRGYIHMRGVRWGARRARSAGTHRGAPRRGGAALEPVKKVLTEKSMTNET